MSGIFRKIIDSFLRTGQAGPRKRSSGGQALLARRERLLADARARQPDQAAAQPWPAEPLEKIEPVFSPQEHPTPQAEDTPVGVAESDLDQLPRTQELEDLAGCPLGRAIERYLALRYPHLKELEDLILAEAGYLLSSDLGRQLLVVDPGEFVEAAVRRAVITVAETRVALRQAVRSRAASAKESSLPEPKSEPVPPLDAQ